MCSWGLCSSKNNQGFDGCSEPTAHMFQPLCGRGLGFCPCCMEMVWGTPSCPVSQSELGEEFKAHSEVHTAEQALAELKHFFPIPCSGALIHLLPPQMLPSQPRTHPSTPVPNACPLLSRPIFACAHHVHTMSST